MIESREIPNKYAVKVNDWWIEDGDLIIDTEKGCYRLTNAYWSSISFGELDYEHTEECIIEQNVQWSRNPGSEEQQAN